MFPFSTHLYSGLHGGRRGGSIAGKLGRSPVGGGCVYASVHGTVMCSSRQYIDCSCMYCTAISLVPRLAVYDQQVCTILHGNETG